MDRKTERYVINVLRRGTLKWNGRTNALRRARKRFRDGKLKNGNVKWKYHWNCAKCGKWFRDESDMEVDHIMEVGPYKGDLHDYAERMYCDEDNLQVLCIRCHKAKTTSAAPLRWKRKKLRK